jgi:hypothetical protein
MRGVTTIKRAVEGAGKPGAPFILLGDQRGHVADAFSASESSGALQTNNINS